MKRLYLIGPLLFLFFLINSSSVLAAASNWQKSASIYPQSVSDFSTDTFKQSVSRLSADGVNYVTLIIPYYQSDIHASSLYAGWNTPSDQSLIDAAGYIHSLGLKVMFKIHLDSADSQWRANINPSNKTAWFSAYQSMLVHFATLAKNNGVEEITIGAELANMSQSQYTQNWKNMIAATRQVYSGYLTYSGNHGGPAEVNSIQFWDSLDYIGISAYYPLATNISYPTVQDLKNSWAYWDTNFISPLNAAWHKPIMFTEVGYRSISGAHYYPWDYSVNNPVDQAEQARDYEAMFSYWNDKSYFQGVHLWDWNSNPNISEPSGFTPKDKQAETTMKQWFGGSGSSSTPAPTPTPTSVPLNTTYNFSGSYQNNQISASVTASNTLTNMLVDWEIYDASGNFLFQRYFDNQTLTAGIPNSYNFSYAPTTNGTYTLKAGIFTAGWSQNPAWNSQVAVFSIGPAATPSPVPTSTPISTPLPTPVPTITVFPTSTPAPASVIQVWWPANNVSVSGSQPFKGLLQNTDINTYQMFWNVDSGQLNSMSISQQDYPHYESWADVSGWSWNGTGPYMLGFIAKDKSGNLISQTSVKIYISR